MRRKCREIKIGNTSIGGGGPVLVQSMLNVPARDVPGNVKQAIALEAAGCQMVRVSVPTMEDVALIPAIKAAVSIPLVADIHFDHRIALAAVDAGVDKIRLNPGNIGDRQNVRAVAKACSKHGVPIRIGVNGGSLEKPLWEKHGGPTAQALVESALGHVRLLEQEDFGDIVISLKSSDVPVNIQAYRLLAQQCDYPLHLGVTEAGTWRAGLIKNAIGIGALLLDGIGDTIRVSLTAEPEKEVEAGFDILRATGSPVKGVEVISCPTCGRTAIPVQAIADEVEQRLKGIQKPLKVAVMGCVVNGLGEGRQADIGLAGGKDSGVLFIKGQQVKTLRGNLVDAFVQEVESFADGGE